MGFNSEQPITPCCRNGHRLSIENAYWKFCKKQGKNYVECRVCRRAAEKQRRLAKPDVFKRRAKKHYDKHRHRIRAQDAARYRANPKPFKDRVRDKTYHLRPGQFDRMLADQNYHCPCGITFDEVNRPEVDHSHACCARGSCGKCVRGLLCRRCNLVLGASNDDPHYLPEFLISYIHSGFICS